MAGGNWSASTELAVLSAVAVLCQSQGAQAPADLARPPNFFQGDLGLTFPQLDTVVLLLVDVIGSIVISLSHCCLPNDEGPGPLNIFS